MQFKIADWPPLASHLAFMLLGISLANYYSDDNEQKFELYKNQHLLFVSSNMYDMQDIEEQVQLIKVDKLKHTPLCKENSPTFIALRNNSSLYIRVDRSQFEKISPFLNSKNHKFTDEFSGKKLPECDKETVVNYGL